MVSANLGGLSLRMIAGLINTSTYSLFVKPNLTSPQELKGKKFGMGSFGSSPDFMMRQIFRRLGLDFERTSPSCSEAEEVTWLGSPRSRPAPSTALF